ncbi:hypothetical protein ANANG_G00301020 [Anguilla anguilla]|uniref:Uncharacterized protein n=1 Tax=Anguilla anguilla TaxID=7936 RepID=A0A9D3LKK7_ANGAN|nr:hypothetical protein ANANG_G00301020 [Anguilla anguilla]
MEGSSCLCTQVCVAECHVENPGLCASFLKTSFISHRREGTMALADKHKVKRLRLDRICEVPPPIITNTRGQRQDRGNLRWRGAGGTGVWLRASFLGPKSRPGHRLAHVLGRVAACRAWRGSLSLPPSQTAALRLFPALLLHFL